MATGSVETIRVIAFQDSGMWVAQCLEYDIGAQAADLDTLRDRLEATLRAEYLESMERHKKPFAGIGPAPDRFHRMWDRRAHSIDFAPLPWVEQEKMKVDFGLAA
jgi:hypothetical protein